MKPEILEKIKIIFKKNGKKKLKKNIMLIEKKITNPSLNMKKKF
jgi:hypothetical protein